MCIMIPSYKSIVVNKTSLFQYSLKQTLPRGGGCQYDVHIILTIYLKILNVKLKAPIKTKFYTSNKIAITMLQVIESRHLDIKSIYRKEEEREEYMCIIMAGTMDKEMQGHDSWLQRLKNLIACLKVYLESSILL